MTDTLAPVAAPRHHLWHRHRTTLLLVVAFLAAVGVALWSSGGARTSTALDPSNPDPDGAKALAQVLGDEGVDIETARSIAELERVDVRARATVVVTSTDYLGRSVIDRMREHVGPARIVLVEPGEGVLEAFGFAFHSSRERRDDDRWRADCDDPLVDGLTLEVDRAMGYDTDGCFIDDDRSLLVTRGEVAVFGAGDALTNDQILRGDNAAASLRLLGQDEQLIWYVPTYEDLTAGDGVSAETLIPQWIRPGIWLAAIIALVVIVWRARRLGPLAREPLPVLVKAIETTQSRGRLYRKAGDRAHAASGLRRATRTRAAERLRLGAGHDEAAVIREVARHVGRSEAEIAMMIGSQSPPPTTDKDLIALATDLAALEEEVRRT